MNISALRAAGLTDADIVKIVETVQADEAARLQARREQTRIRVKNHRLRNACNALHALHDDLLEPVEDMRTNLFRIGTMTLMAWGIPERRCRSMIGMWLKKRDDPEGLLALIKYTRDRNVAEPIAYISSMVGGLNGNGNDNRSRSRSLDEVARSLEAKCCEREEKI